MSQEKFQLVKMSGEPGLRGVQYGSQVKDKIWQNIDGYQKYFKKSLGLDWSMVLERTKEYVAILETQFSDNLLEVDGIARGAGVDFADIMAINCRYELLHFENSCTSMVALPGATLEKKTILAQNWDYRPWTLKNSVLLHMEYEDGTKIFGLAEAGQLIRNGINNHGFGVCVNSIKSIHDYTGIGYPVTFIRRKLLSCKNYSDAVEVVVNAKRTVSNNYLLACKEGEAVDIEATPTEVFKILPADGIYAHANHIQSKREIDVKEVDSFRDKRLYSLLKEKVGSITIDTVKEDLKDHANYPKGICSHNTEDNNWQTNAALIYDLSQGKAYITYGPPCEGTYVEYDI